MKRMKTGYGARYKETYDEAYKLKELQGDVLREYLRARIGLRIHF